MLRRRRTKVVPIAKRLLFLFVKTVVETMSETRRAWTPERVDRLLDTLEATGQDLKRLVAAEYRVGDMIEKALDLGAREAQLSEMPLFEEGEEE